MVTRKAELFRTIVVLLCLVLFATPKESFAQYFISQNDPLRKWSQIKTENLRVVFPQDNPYTGLITATYMDKLTPFITLGLQRPLQKFPVLIHSSNLLSNGLVTWVPKRMELYSIPSRNTFATQWMKQLVTHEFRHVAQMSSINIGMTKAVSYIIGEQAPGIVSMMLPTYLLEGEATLFETLFSTYGRGRQPNFTIDYRAILNSRTTIFRNTNPNKINIDKMLLGSYKDYVPSVYSAGYLLVGAATRYYGGDFWGKIYEYAGKYPITIVPVAIAFDKYAKANMGDLTIRAFKELDEHWKKYSMVPNTSTVLCSKQTSYTTYNDILPLNDTLVIALKQDMDKTSRFVSINLKTQQEQQIHYTGYVTSRPIIKDNVIYWTEHEPSKSWGNKNASVVKSMELSFNKKGKLKYKTFKTKRITQYGVYYLAAMGDDGFAMISYNEQSLPELVITDENFNIESKHLMKWFDSSFNGLTWDNVTKSIYGIILNDEGMWIGRFNQPNNRFEKFTKPSYVTLNNLSATDGKLYFTSIYSGKDEMHVMDLLDGMEYKITQSQYGSFASGLGSLWSQRTQNDSLALMTTYSIKGYLPAIQKINRDKKDKVKYAYIPKDLMGMEYDSLLNIMASEGPIINLDTVKVDSSIIENYDIKKYRKGLNAFNIHSWAPIYMDIDKIMNEFVPVIGLGASFMSQNLLSDIIITGGVGYYNKMFAANGSVKYTGLPVKIGARVDYGGGYQQVQSSIRSEQRPTSRSGGSFDKYLSLSSELSLPLNFTRGVNIRHLNLSMGYSHTNTRLLSDLKNDEGIDKMNFSVSFGNYKRSTRKMMAPRLGYIVEAYSAINLVMSDFGDVYGIYVKGFLPGIMRDHTLQISALCQYQDQGMFNFMQKGMFPLGAYNDFTAKSVFSTRLLYKLPIAYPDWGFLSTLYFRRITLTLLGDYAYCEPTSNYADVITTRNFYTYGAAIDFEMNVFRISYPVTLGVTVYKTNTYNSVGWMLNFGIAF